MAILIPGYNNDTSTESMYQASPLLHNYSPRLLGAPPQLTSLNDMRMLSANDTMEGPVGDYYLNKILRDAQIANFVVGRAIFTGGMSSLANAIRVCGQYAYALSKYDIYASNGNESASQISNRNAYSEALTQMNLEAYKNALNTGDEGDDKFNVEEQYSTDGSGSGLTNIDDGIGIYKLPESQTNLIKSITNILDAGGNGGAAGGTLYSMLLTSLSVQQPFYTFESDWKTYINNVKMMINTAVIMLGLQKACVRIGDNYYPIGLNVKESPETDCWANYRYITPSTGLGDVTAIDSQTGDTTQYVSFMVNAPASIAESYTNTVGPSQIYANIINQGSSIGNEIAFLTNTSKNKIDDAVISLAGKATNIAEKIVGSLTAGTGRFSAAILGSMSRSFTGDHTIYPEIFQSSTTAQSVSFTINLNASGGDPYSYLVDILVPMFYMFGMVLPRLSKNNASAYSYPPIIQCNIPGLWGTRLGMVTGLSITKNPSGTQASVNGWPTSVSMNVTITDLQHVLMTSPMDEVSTFLNNNTMFDYIAQCCGVDKYRVNGSIRQVSKLTLAASFANNILENIGDAALTDLHGLGNKLSGVYRL